MVKNSSIEKIYFVGTYWNCLYVLLNKMIELFDPSLHEVIVTEGEKDMSSISIPSNVGLACR